MSTPSKTESHSSFMQIDSSNTWSDLKDETSHRFDRPSFPPQTIQPIGSPSTPELHAKHSYGSDDTPYIPDLHDIMPDHPSVNNNLSSLFISATTLEAERFETNERETETTRDANTCAPSSFDDDKENICPNVPFHNRQSITRNAQQTRKFSIRPRRERQRSFPRRDSAHSLPTPNEMQVGKLFTLQSVLSKKSSLPYRRHIVMNATTGFR
jgi:hypothetical protein